MSMPATIRRSPKPPITPEPAPQPLHLLHEQGGLSDDEFVFCRILLYLHKEPLVDALQPLADKLLATVSGQSVEAVAEHRRTLKARELLAYEFDPQDGKYRYRPFLYNEYTVARGMLQAIFPKRPRRQRAKAKKPRQPQDRWIVLDQGRCAHLLRPDDLFPAERTLCGLPADDGAGQPLPRLNSQPADYQGCERCSRLTSSPSSGSPR